MSTIATAPTGTIQFFTAPTPNGHKVSVLLEELKATYGLQYTAKSLDFSKSEQKEPWFLKINPNGRIPAITDENRDNFNVFESAAILLYLVQHYDPDFQFMFDPVNDANNYSEALQWIFFTHGGIGPMQGQAAHFFRFAPEKIPYAIDRYITEVKRLYSVLESRLQSRDYLVGDGRGRYSIADMNCFPWIRAHPWAGLEDSIMDDFPHVAAWLKRLEERPAVYEGLGVPVRRPKMSKEEMNELAEKLRGMFSQPQK